MKKNILLAFIGGVLLFAACDPIEKRNDLEPITLQESDIELTLTVDGNYVTCTSNVTLDDTKAAPHWDWEIGYSTEQNPVVHLPLPGTYTFTFTALVGGGKVITTREVTIAQKDEEFYNNAMWTLLTNDDAGKTWVWATDKPSATTWGVGPWLAGADQTEGKGLWWGQTFPDLAEQGTSSDDELYFDLNKRQNYSLTQNDPESKPGNGSGFFTMDIGPEYFVLNGADVYSYGTIKFTGSTLPIGFEPNTDGKPYVYEYEILRLTEDELVLCWPEGGREAGAWSGAWFFQFKRKGYTY